MNKFLTRVMTIALTSMISMSINPYQVVDAGCNCQNGSTVMQGMPMTTMSTPYVQSNQVVTMPSQGVYAAQTLPKTSPPPGSLGYTYKKRSRLVPKDKHPRLGMVEIKGIAHGCQVNIDGMKGYISESGTWMFESERPLLPHRKHIYRIEVKQSIDQQKPDVRVIRLIPGRVVDYQY